MPVGPQMQKGAEKEQKVQADRQYRPVPLDFAVATALVTRNLIPRHLK
jgi:hypothetical protein